MDSVLYPTYPMPLSRPYGIRIAWSRETGQPAGVRRFSSSGRCAATLAGETCDELRTPAGAAAPSGMDRRIARRRAAGVRIGPQRGPDRPGG
ncbi:hypothetical protein AB0F72_29000 [Actinoplanes sp. NPDC023936]|uniref:hypothetical protein n=1 Tax=Actinoplanes sp. NPDC023936 TaxID=3154910 RepID=UPI0033C0E892